MRAGALKSSPQHRDILCSPPLLGLSTCAHVPPARPGCIPVLELRPGAEPPPWMSPILLHGRAPQGCKELSTAPILPTQGRCPFWQQRGCPWRGAALGHPEQGQQRPSCCWGRQSVCQAGTTSLTARTWAGMSLPASHLHVSPGSSLLTAPGFGESPWVLVWGRGTPGMRVVGAVWAPERGRTAEVGSDVRSWHRA